MDSSVKRSPAFFPLPRWGDLPITACPPLWVTGQHPYQETSSRGRGEVLGGILCSIPSTFMDILSFSILPQSHEGDRTDLILSVLYFFLGGGVFFFVFLGPHPQHIEIRLGVQSEL